MATSRNLLVLKVDDNILHFICCQAALDSPFPMAQAYLKNYEPYLHDTAAYPKMQVSVYTEESFFGSVGSGTGNLIKVKQSVSYLLAVFAGGKIS